MSRSRVALLVAGLLAMLAGCRFPPTEVLVALDTDAPLARALTIRARAQRGASTDPAPGGDVQTFTRGGGGATTLPGDFALVPGDGPRDGLVTLVVEADLAPGAGAGEPALHLRRLARFSFVPHRALRVALVLPMACAAARAGCTSVADAACTVSQYCEDHGQTCGDLGTCVPIEVQPTPLDAGGPPPPPPDDVAADTASDAAPDAGPVVAAPRPIAPLSTSTVTTHRPTLRWAAGSGSDGTIVTLCRDRAMITGCTSFNPMGASMAVASEMARGVWYWRLESLAHGAATGARGPVWQFVVPGRASAGDTSWGTQGDVNGDGFSDVVVGAPRAAGGAGRVYVFHGASAGVRAAPDETLAPPPGVPTDFGGHVESVGDVNGDGFGDLAVIAAYTSATGPLSVHLGGPAGLAAAPRVLLGLAGAPMQFVRMTALGDADGDGYADFAVVAQAPAATPAQVWVYYGAPDGVRASTTTVTNPGASGDSFGLSVTGPGDMNGDGRGELAVGASDAESSTGYVYLYPGSPAGTPTTPGLTIRGPDGVAAFFGTAVASMGDLDGDGFADLVASATNFMAATGRVHVFRGGSTLDATSDATLTGPDGTTARYGSALAAGDLNGDGLPDLAVGSTRTIGGAGPFVHVYFAGTTGLPVTPTATLMSPDSTDLAFGAGLVAPRDVDGDAVDDLVVSGQGAADQQGRVYVYTAGAAAPMVRLVTTLAPPTTSPELFGGWIACARRGRGAAPSRRVRCNLGVR